MIESPTNDYLLQVVLLCDNGIASSESALTGYCQLHRLMLALVKRFPRLRELAERRLLRFLQDPRMRTKAFTPSLGDLICMLLVTDRFHWRDIAMPYLFESFDRSVLWACSKDPSLAKVTPGDTSRLDKFMVAHGVGLRLVLFHAVFLDLLLYTGTTRGNRITECCERYDMFLGRPPLHLRRSWHSAVKNILALNSWPQFFTVGRFPKLPTPSQLLSSLEEAVGNSLKKGYHSHDTKFENVMRSGVSRILLKGDSYSVSPGIKQLKMHERWRYDNETIFLDASCLIYDFNGRLVGIVDYSHRTWKATDAAAYKGKDVFGAMHYPSRHDSNDFCPVKHSGDVVADGMGEHTITITVSALPPFVSSLVFTVSAWTTTLKDVAQPSAHLHDVDADSELCAYTHAERDTGSNTAVIMCKLQRPKPNGKWQLTSIGHVGLGRADSYGHILEDIQVLEILRHAAPAAESGSAEQKESGDTP
jgi:stress response protein SCP2